MVLIKKINVDINGNISEDFILDGENILPETYYTLETELEESLKSELEEEDYAFDEFCEAFTYSVQDVVALMEKPCCPACLTEALVNLVALGAEGASKGWIEFD